MSRLTRALVISIGVALAPAAHADDTGACIEANSSGQELRLKGHWKDAEARFNTCLRAPCPVEIAQDCAARYEDLRAAIPTLLVAARQPDGADTIDARLYIDGTLVATQLPSVAVELDPGEHVIAIAHEGWTSARQRIVTREREKGRSVAFQFEASTPNHRASSVSGIVVTTAGAVVSATGIAVLLAGLVQYTSLSANTCALTATCAPSSVSAIKVDYGVGAAVSVVGLVALGIGIWMVATHASRRD